MVGFWVGPWFLPGLLGSPMGVSHYIGPPLPTPHFSQTLLAIGPGVHLETTCWPHGAIFFFICVLLVSSMSFFFWLGGLGGHLGATKMPPVLFLLKIQRGFHKPPSNTKTPNTHTHLSKAEAHPFNSQAFQHHKPQQSSLRAATHFHLNTPTLETPK